MERYLPILSKLPIFDGIAKDEILPLCRLFGCCTRKYGTGAVLWSRGDRVSAAGIVLSGKVRAENNRMDGTQRIIAQHGTGALFGDVLMSSQMQRSPVDIVASEDTTVLFLPLAQVMRDCGGVLSGAQTRFRLNLLGEISDKYWALYRRLGYLSEPTLRGRLARYLLLQRDGQGSDTIRFAVTRETMAAELCVNRSAMCRELGRMQRDGLIVLSRRECRLCDLTGLRLLAE